MRYEQQRDRATREDYWRNLSGARFQPPPDEVLRVRAAIRGNPDAIRQFFLAREAMTPANPLVQS